MAKETLKAVGGGSPPWRGTLEEVLKPLASQFDFNRTALLSTSASTTALTTNVMRGLVGPIADLHTASAMVKIKPLLETGKFAGNYRYLSQSLAPSLLSTSEPTDSALRAIRSISPVPPLSEAVRQSLAESSLLIGAASQEVVSVMRKASRSWDVSVPMAQFVGITETVANLTRALTESVHMPFALSAGVGAGPASGLGSIDGTLMSQALLGASATVESAQAMLSVLPVYDWAALGRSPVFDAAAAMRGAADARPEGEISRLVEERAESILEDDRLLARFEQSSGLRGTEDPVARGVRLRAALLRFARRAAYSPAAKAALVTALVWVHTNLPEAYDAAGDWIEFVGLVWAVANAKPKGQ